MKKDITKSGELKDALDELIAIPEDDHEAFVNDYKIVILPCENKARFWFNITTKHLLKRYKENPQKLIQIDGTYKLIWNPDKCKEGFPVQVHGTSNVINDFFPTGLCVSSNENHETYQEIFESFGDNMNYLMADESRAITKA